MTSRRTRRKCAAAVVARIGCVSLSLSLSLSLSAGISALGEFFLDGIIGTFREKNEKKTIIIIITHPVSTKLEYVVFKMWCVSCSSIGVALLLLLVIICAMSEGARYRAKFAVFIILSAISASIFIPLMLFRPRSWKNALLPAAGCRLTAKLLGVKFEVRGKENIVKDTACVVFINHQSYFDLIVLAELWPVLERCTVISKKEILYLGTFGLASWLWGTVFIDRLNVASAKNSINSTADIISQRKAKLLLFPEGKRHSNTTLIPFKKGGFHVAVASQMPIQPVVVSKYYFLNDRLKKFDNGTSYITILPAIETKGLTRDDIPRLIEQTHDIMNKTFVESSQEALQNHVKNLKTD